MDAPLCFIGYVAICVSLLVPIYVLIMHDETCRNECKCIDCWFVAWLEL